MSEEFKKRIIHVSLQVGKAVLMGVIQGEIADLSLL